MMRPTRLSRAVWVWLCHCIWVGERNAFSQWPPTPSLPFCSVVSKIRSRSSRTTSLFQLPGSNTAPNISGMSSCMHSRHRVGAVPNWWSPLPMRVQACEKYLAASRPTQRPYRPAHSFVSGRVKDSRSPSRRKKMKAPMRLNLRYRTTERPNSRQLPTDRGRQCCVTPDPARLGPCGVGGKPHKLIIVATARILVTNANAVPKKMASHKLVPNTEKTRSRKHRC